MTAPVNPEGQTAQEVRHAALEEAALFVEKHQHPMWTRFAVAQTIRALASTPSPAKQTEQKIASAEGAAFQTATPVTLQGEEASHGAIVEAVVQGRRDQQAQDGESGAAAQGRGVRGEKVSASCAGDPGVRAQDAAPRGSDRPDERRAPSLPAVRNGASGDAAVADGGTASQLGAAPAPAVTSNGEYGAREVPVPPYAFAGLLRTEVDAHAHDGCTHAWPRAVLAYLAEHPESAPAQPDARDAEIARLTALVARMRDAAGNGCGVCHCAALAESQAGVARLTKELEEAKTKLAHAENARDARQNEREEQRAKAAKANRRADAAEADAEALREALAKAPHAGDCAATTIKDYRWPVTMPHPQRIVTPRVPADEAKCDCWKSKALAPPEPKAETPAETAGQKEGR